MGVALCMWDLLKYKNCIFNHAVNEEIDHDIEIAKLCPEKDICIQ